MFLPPRLLLFALLLLHPLPAASRTPLRYSEYYTIFYGGGICCCLGGSLHTYCRFLKYFLNLNSLPPFPLGWSGSVLAPSSSSGKRSSLSPAFTSGGFVVRLVHGVEVCGIRAKPTSSALGVPELYQLVGGGAVMSFVLASGEKVWTRCS